MRVGEPCLQRQAANSLRSKRQEAAVDAGRIAGTFLRTFVRIFEFKVVALLLVVVAGIGTDTGKVLQREVCGSAVKIETSLCCGEIGRAIL